MRRHMVVRSFLTFSVGLIGSIGIIAGAESSEAAEADASKSAAQNENMPPLRLVFEDDFEEGLDRWEFTDPEAWELVEENGNRALGLIAESDYEPPVRSPRSIAWIKGVDAKSFVLEARLKQTGREYGHRDLCIFFGKQDPAHFYYVHLATKADPHAHSIFLVNDEPRVSIADERTDGIDWGEGYHRIKIERNAHTGRISVYFDDMDTPIMQAEDKTFTSGVLGFGSFDDVGHFDSIRIWAENGEE